MCPLSVPLTLQLAGVALSVRVQEGQHGQYQAMNFGALRQLKLHQDAAHVLLDRSLRPPQGLPIPALDRPSPIRASPSRSRAVRPSVECFGGIRISTGSCPHHDYRPQTAR